MLRVSPSLPGILRIQCRISRLPPRLVADREKRFRKTRVQLKVGQHVAQIHQLFQSQLRDHQGPSLLEKLLRQRTPRCFAYPLLLLMMRTF